MIAWDESLAVGVASIDEQHRNLFRLIQRLEGVSELHATELEAVIDALLDYAQIHFQTEEEYFERFAYAERNDHEREHSEFIVQAVGFRKQFEQEHTVSVRQIHGFLIDWLTRHIKGSDMKFKGLFTD